MPEVIFHSHLSFSGFSCAHLSLWLGYHIDVTGYNCSPVEILWSVGWVEPPEIKVVLPGLGWVVTL